MNFLSIALFSGAMLMAQSNDSIRVEPGKQLPQSLKIRVDGKAAAGDVTMRYLLFAPKDYKADGKKWPLMLFLHGLGECSNDDLSRVKIHGPAHLVDSRPDFPFVVVTPQLPPPAGYKEGVTYTSDQIIALARNAWKARGTDSACRSCNGEVEYRSRSCLCDWAQHGRIRHVATGGDVSGSIRGGDADLRRRRAGEDGCGAESCADLGISWREGRGRAA